MQIMILSMEVAEKICKVHDYVSPLVPDQTTYYLRTLQIKEVTDLIF